MGHIYTSNLHVLSHIYTPTTDLTLCHIYTPTPDPVLGDIYTMCVYTCDK